jgi:hypothetical protein
MTCSRRLKVGLGRFFERGIAYGSNGSRTANSVKRIFGTSFWPPIGAIFKPKIVRETTTYGGWLQPSKSYDFVPIPVIRHPSISLLICEPYLQFKEFSRGREIPPPFWGIGKRKAHADYAHGLFYF